MKHCIALTGFVAVLAAGCADNSVRKLNGTGSTFVAPIMSKWEEEYRQAKNVEIDYEALGSSVGVQRLAGGVFDFACTDAPLSDKQVERLTKSGGDVLRVPLVIGAVAVACNLEEVKGPLTLSGPLLADIYLGKVKKWNADAIKELNPGVKLPDREISVVHRQEGSGTTYIWTDYLSKVSSPWKSQVGVGTTVNWPTGVGMAGTRGMADEVKRVSGGIGYLQLNDALKNNLQVALVKNSAGVAIKASPESLTAAANSALSTVPDNLQFSLTDAPGKDAYPISGAVWAILYVKQKATRGPAVIEFLRWATHEGQEYAGALHYAPLPKKLVAAVEKKLELATIGK